MSDSARQGRDIYLERATGWLMESQDEAGWWCGELETNVTMTAEHVLLLTFLRQSAMLEAIRQRAITHILRNQRQDGSWALFHDAPADLSTTIEAYVALKVLGVDPDRDEMRRALSVIQQQGGVAHARVFTKIWLALFGQYPWSGVPSMPPELIWLPANVPFNLYDFACWARGTIAPLTVVLAHKPVRSLGCNLPELVVPGTEPLLRRVPGSGLFWWTDKLLKLYEALPRQPGRKRAEHDMLAWVVERQDADGSWGGIQPPWVYSLIALDLQGMTADDPVMRMGLQGLAKDFALSDESGWRLQACMSPVWDTAWALQALARAGLKPDHPVLRRGVQWLLDEQIFHWGDWQVRTGPIECGGWAFEFQNDIYPDIDDTAVIVVALLDAGEGPEVQVAIDQAVDWVIAMRSSNHAWGAFDRDNWSDIVYKLPFADFGALLDPPSEDVTAHAIEMLARSGYQPHDRIVAEGLAYLRREQRADGSWWGRWGVNHIYGTWCVIAALSALYGTGERLPQRAQRAVQWMLSRQNPDGGWGETAWSYQDPSFAGVGDSTASQTAWAVMTLQMGGLGKHPATQRGLNYLRDQMIDGTWQERQFTGTGFPRDFYINYHLYRHLFPLMALANDQRQSTL